MDPTNDAERPLECGKCKKPVRVHYTEMVGKSITHTIMCADCPELQRRLHGIPPADKVTGVGEGTAGLCCGECGTTLEEVKRGHPLGCEQCYNVFGDIIVLELVAAGRLAPRFSNQKKPLPIHVGRAPGESLTISPASKLLALNEALKETLSREDYEQAALLRDQIKEITDNTTTEGEGNKNEQ